MFGKKKEMTFAEALAEVNRHSANKKLSREMMRYEKCTFANLKYYLVTLTFISKSGYRPYNEVWVLRETTSVYEHFAYTLNLAEGNLVLLNYNEISESEANAIELPLDARRHIEICK